MTLILCDLSEKGITVVADSCRMEGGKGPPRLVRGARKIVRSGGIAVALYGDWVLPPERLAPDAWVEKWLGNVTGTSDPREAALLLEQSLNATIPLDYCAGGGFVVAGCEDGVPIVSELLGSSNSASDLTLSFKTREYVGPQSDPIVRGFYMSWQDLINDNPSFSLPVATNTALRSQALESLVATVETRLSLTKRLGVPAPARVEILNCTV